MKALWAPVQEGVKVVFFKYSLDWQWWLLEGLKYSCRYATIMVAMIWMFIHRYPILAQRVRGHYGNVLRISMWIFTVDCEKLQHIVDITKTPSTKNHKLGFKAMKSWLHKTNPSLKEKKKKDKTVNVIPSTESILLSLMVKQSSFWNPK